jgi:LysM repeat protein
MNTPSPLIPQGSLERQSKGKSTVRIAIFTIVSIHAVFFAGLLMQGCRRDDAKATSKSPDTSMNAPTTPTDNPTYYSNSNTATQEVVQASNPPPIAATPAVPVPVVEPKPITPPAPAGTEPSIEGKSYKIGRGDTLAKIARANGVTLKALTAANPTVDPFKLKVGQTIQIPGGTPGSNGIGFAEPGKSDGMASSPAAGVYTVKAGDTLTRIAKHHGTTPKVLRAINNLKTDRLVVNQKLKLPMDKNANSSADTTSPGSVSKLTATNPAYVTPVPTGSSSSAVP